MHFITLYFVHIIFAYEPYDTLYETWVMVEYQQVSNHAVPIPAFSFKAFFSISIGMANAFQMKILAGSVQC